MPSKPDYVKIAKLEKDLGVELIVRGEAHNDILAELSSLGLSDGVETTVNKDGTTVRAGKLEFNGGSLNSALGQLRDAVKALPAKERPKAYEATTRTVMELYEYEDGTRALEERLLDAKDFD